MTRPTAARTKQALGHCGTTPKFGVFSLIAAAFLAACSPTTEGGFSFATRNDQPQALSRLPAPSQAQFADGEVVLVAPPGHCIDTSMLRQEADGGFALLPRCNMINGPSLFGRKQAALITAAIGPAQESDAPNPLDIAETVEGARLLYYDNNGMLPLARLYWPGHGAAGTADATVASAEHWRGAFVLNDHMVLLALYAPEGSPLLGKAGAALLSEMTRRTLEASLVDKVEAPEGDLAPALSQSAPTGVGAHSLRPRARPSATDTAAASQGSTENPAMNRRGAQKLSLRRRIAGLFQ